MFDSMSVPETGERTTSGQAASQPSDCKSTDKSWHDPAWAGPGLRKDPRSKFPGVAPVEPDSEPAPPWRSHDSDKQIANRVYTMITSMAERVITSVAERWMNCRETVYVQPTLRGHRRRRRRWKCKSNGAAGCAIA